MKQFIKQIYRRFRPVILHGKDNSVRSLSKYSQGFWIDVYGDNNVIEIAEDCMLSNTSVLIYGNNNRLTIDKKARFMGPCRITMEGDSSLLIGEDAGVRDVQFILKDADIEVGKLCMFSNHIVLRNTDSHKVISIEDNRVKNQACDIRLGEHVWIGQNATILKGVSIGSNSIVAMGTIVTKDVPDNSIVAGVPSRVVKTGITWDY